MATRGRGGGIRTVTRKPAAKRKRKCELGISCPYQNEYQHQLEFTHNDGVTEAGSSDRPRARQRGKGTLAKHTSGLLKGTGHRGRMVAVAADRRRAERAQRRKCDQADAETSQQDAHTAQRNHWVMKMQQQQRQQQLLQQQQHQQQGNRGGANGGEEFGRSKEERSRVKSPSQGDPLLSQQPKRWSSKSQIPHHDTIPDGAKDALGEVVERERRKPHGARDCSKDDGDIREHERRGIQIGFDCDDNDEESMDQAQNQSITAAIDPLPSTARTSTARICHSASVDVVEMTNVHNRDDNPPSVRADDAWSCAACTFRNTNSLGLACELCGTERNA